MIREMKFNKFCSWMLDNNIFKSKKMISDCASRVANIERSLSINGVVFDIDEEYKKDSCVLLLRALSCDGQCPEMEHFMPNSLPIGKKTMRMLRYSLQKYIEFKRSMDVVLK